MGFVRNEKLRAVGVWPRVCHRYNASSAVLEGVYNFIRKFASWCVVDGLSSLASSCRIATLNHEPLDIAMKDCAVVIARCAQG